VTSYYFETNKNNWKPFVPLLADCMQNSRFDAEHLASEVKAVMQELRMGRDNFWQRMSKKAFELSFPANHPYHVPIIGYKEDLLSMSADHLKEFYKKYYRPDRATLFLIGDIDIDDAVQYAKENFKDLRADKQSVVKEFPTIIPQLEVSQTTIYEDVKQDQLGFYWIIPGLRNSDEVVATVTDAILGGGQSGRLYRILVDEKKLASSVYVKASKLMEAGLFLIFVEPLEGKSEECEAVIRHELEEIMKHGVKQVELDRVAKNASRKFFEAMQDFTSFCYAWINSYFATHDEMHIFKRVNEFYSVDSDQVKAFVTQHLDPFLMSRVEVLPLPEEKRERKELIKKASQELDQKILARYARTAPIEEPRAALTYPTPDPLAFQFPKPDRVVELANGLKVILLAKRDAPLVSLVCTFKDAKFLADAKEGILLNLAMDELVEGSKGYSKKENVDFFEAHGTSYAFDARGGRFLCLNTELEETIQRFFHILAKPTFPSDAHEKLKKIFIDNYHRAEDDAKSVGRRLLKNIMYPQHPFAWTFEEAIKMIQDASASDMQKLHAEYVCPANMVLALVGDFNVDDAVGVVERVFGRWAGGVRKQFSPTSAAYKPNVQIDHSMSRDQVMLYLGKTSPVTVYHPDFVPLQLLSTICFASLGSRIYKLREQTGLFYSAGGSFASNASKEHGFDLMAMLVSPENAVHAEEKLRELMLGIVDNGFLAEELDAARIMYLKEMIDLVTDSTSIARMFCTLDSLDLGFDYYDHVLQLVQTYSLEDLNKLAKKYIDTTGMARVRVGPINLIGSDNTVGV